MQWIARGWVDGFILVVAREVGAAFGTEYWILGTDINIFSSSFYSYVARVALVSVRNGIGLGFWMALGIESWGVLA